MHVKLKVLCNTILQVLVDNRIIGVATTKQKSWFDKDWIGELRSRSLTVEKVKYEGWISPESLAIDNGGTCNAFRVERWYSSIQTFNCTNPSVVGSSATVSFRSLSFISSLFDVACSTTSLPRDANRDWKLIRTCGYPSLLLLWSCLFQAIPIAKITITATIKPTTAVV